MPFSCVCGGLVARARLKVGRDGAGIETLSIHGELTLAAPVDPAGAGLLLGVSDAGGSWLSARALPGGTGWRVDRAAARWVFSDPLATAAGGITRVVLRERSRPAGRFVFRIAVRRPLPPPRPLHLPAQFSIRIGRPNAAPCATTAQNEMV